MDDFKANADWLAPHFFDPVREQIIISIHAYVLKTPHHTILVDTCMGNDKNRPARQIFHMRSGSFLEDMRAAGCAPEEVDYVMCTHLHADHVGWNTRLQDGAWVPTFANAKYLFAREELEYFANLPEDGNHCEAYRDSVLPVIQSGQAVTVETDYALDDQVWLEPSPGHTPGHYSVRIASKGEEAVFSGDLMHHPAQCAKPEWISLACIDAERSRATRRAFLDRYAESGVTVFAAHFASPTAGHIVADGDKLKFRVRE